MHCLLTLRSDFSLETLRSDFSLEWRPSFSEEALHEFCWYKSCNRLKNEYYSNVSNGKALKSQVIKYVSL